MNTEEQLQDLVEENEARVTTLNDLHVQLQLERLALPREATAFAPPSVAHGEPPATGAPTAHNAALEALLAGLVAEAATLKHKQQYLVERSVHALEHNLKGDSEALLAQEVACTNQQFDEAEVHLRSQIRAEEAAAARMREMTAEQRMIAAGIDEMEREAGAPAADAVAEYRSGLRAHLSALLATFFPPAQEAPEAGGGKRARSMPQRSMEALVFALLDEWPAGVDLGTSAEPVYQTEHVDLLLRSGIAERDSASASELRLVNFSE